MSEKTFERLYWISSLGLLAASIIFLCLHFVQDSDEACLIAALCCSWLMNFFHIARNARSGKQK